MGVEVIEFIIKKQGAGNSFSVRILSHGETASMVPGIYRQRNG